MKQFLFSNPTRKSLQVIVLLAVLLFQLGLGSAGLAHALTCLLNDTFDCRTVIGTPTYYPAALDTTGAATAGETGEQGISVTCNPHQPEDNRTLYLGHKSVWYEYTPTSTASIYMDTIGSNYDTYIAVWVDPTPATGTTLNELSLVACDDDTLAGKTSQLSFIGTAGTTYYIQIAQYNGYYYNGVRTVPTGGSLKFQLYDIPGVGIYDDTDPHWSYIGPSWATYTGVEPYNATMHYTGTVGAIAWFPFEGTQFILTYTQNTNRGLIDVYVDGSRVGTINANGALQWQRTYTSLIFPAGIHVVQFKHAGSGTYIDVDAIQILNTAAPGVGIYDNTYSNWSYAGSWTSYSGSGPYNNTMIYTSTVGNAAWFSFEGTQFILTYTQNPNRGLIDVYVDGSKVGTINANGALQWQKTYTSLVFPAGTHLVQFKHAGGGTYIDVDAIQILNTAAPGAGIYDNTYTNWSYAGSWTPYSGSGPYNNTMRYTSTVGDAAWFSFTGTQFILTYTQNTNRGDIGVYVDGNKSGTISANGTLQWQKMYISPIFALGIHVVQFKHEGGGAYIDIDAIKVLDSAVPGVGVYDNTDANWIYSGAWTIFNGSGPYNNTLRYTSVVGNLASFVFDGTQFIFTYTQYTNRGLIDVYVDGSKVGTINANGALQWKKTYTSLIFPAGIHVVQFKHAGSGTYIDIDAIQILNAAAPGLGIYDDADANWSYTGSWTPYSGSGPYNNTMRYTTTVGDSAWFSFEGTQFILTYTQNINRGLIDVYVDGRKAGTINANGALQWQTTYTSLIFPAGTHLIQLKHAGGGTYVDIDAIQILSTPAPGAGIYDNTDAYWSYAGSWTSYSGSGPYNNTMRYTSTAGDAAWFSFEGTQFILTYTQNINRGLIDVYVDGSKVGTINANGALQWQKIYTSLVFPAGMHLVQFKHAGGGTYIDIDAIQIIN